MNYFLMNNLDKVPPSKKNIYIIYFFMLHPVLQKFFSTTYYALTY